MLILKPLLFRPLVFSYCFYPQEISFGKISAMLNERSEGVKKVYTKVENDRAEAERLK